MTNMGIVHPEPGYHERLRELTRAAGTLLIVDETHTFSAGPGGCTAAWGLEPDLLTIGKAIGSGIPSGALGLSAAVAGALLADPDADYEDTGGVGGTLAGNALSAAAMRATLEHVLTEEAFAHTVPLAERFAAGVEERDRRARAAVARDAARLPRRVRLHRPAAARTAPSAHAAVRPRAGALPAPARAQPRRDDHAVPQHGADGARPRPRPTSTATPRSSPRRSGSSPADAGARARRPAPAAGSGADGQAAARRRGRAARRPRPRVDRVAADAADPAHRRARQPRPVRPAARRWRSRTCTGGAPRSAACPWPASRAACATGAAARTSTRSARRASSPASCRPPTC